MFHHCFGIPFWSLDSYKVPILIPTKDLPTWLCRLLEAAISWPSDWWWRSTPYRVIKYCWGNIWIYFHVHMGRGGFDALCTLLARQPSPKASTVLVRCFSPAIGDPSQDGTKGPRLIMQHLGTLGSQSQIKTCLKDGKPLWSSVFPLVTSQDFKHFQPNPAKNHDYVFLHENYTSIYGRK